MRPPAAAGRASRRREQGAVLVELALVLPLFAAFLLVIADLGLVLREYQVVQNAAREGARYSIIQTSWIDPRNPGATEAAIKQRVLDYLAQEGIRDVAVEAITVSQTYPIEVNGMTLYGSSITVSYQRPLLFSGAGFESFRFGFLPFPTVTLTGRAVFRNLY